MTAEAPEGAFPEGTVMEVRRVFNADTLSDIHETVAEDFVEVRKVYAVDITFLHSGAEVQPRVPVSVAIGMDRILTEYYSWRSQSSDPGAQIDLIIDRADGFLNLCEVKYAKGDYALTKAEAEKIDNRVSAFQQETGTDKNILVTLITVKPVKENAWTDTVSSFVTLKDLLV